MLQRFVVLRQATSERMERDDICAPAMSSQLTAQLFAREMELIP